MVDLVKQTNDSMSLYKAAKIKDRVYTGKKLTPAPKLSVQVNNEGSVYDLSTIKYPNDRFGYTASYKNNQNIGLATVTVAGTGEVKGTKKVTFKIVPAKAAFSSVKAWKKAFTAKIKAQKGGKYELQYRLGKGKWIKKTGTNAAFIVKKLKSKKTYQVRARVFKKVSGKTYTGAWSKVKSVRVK